ncbi:MAG: type II secretion system F family protein [Candidatus Brocadiia bacterium]
MTAPQCNPDLNHFWSRLTELQCGGQPLLSSLRTVEKELAGRPMAAVVQAVADEVEKGALLSASLRKRTDVFGRAAICFVEGAEYAGILDRALLFILDGLWRCPTCASWNPSSEIAAASSEKQTT